MKFPLCYEATISRAEFLRTLPAAADDDGFREAEGQLVGNGWAIRLTPITPFGVGMVRLERHRVEIEFDGLTEKEQDRFMRRFTLYFQRGGG